MDLIDILLRQDVDIGVTSEVGEESTTSDVSSETALKVKIKDSAESVEERCRVWDEDKPPALPLLGCDPWAGLNYTIDSETGEHVVLDDDCSPRPVVQEEEDKGKEPLFQTATGSPTYYHFADDISAIFEDFHLSLDDRVAQLTAEVTLKEKKKLLEEEVLDTGNSLLYQQLKDLEEMIQTAQLHPVHQVQALTTGRSTLHQSRVPYLRSMSMEQRWQDLSNVLSMPPNVNGGGEPDMHHHHHHHHLHHHHHNMSMGLHIAGPMVRSGTVPNPPHHHISNPNYTTIPGYTAIDNRTTVLLQNATLPTPMTDLNSNLTYHHNELGGSDSIGAAVVTSMSTLANGSELMGVDGHSGGGGYAMDVMMFPNGNHSDSNPNTANGVSSAVGANSGAGDGFLSAIINEDDLQLMEMAMNEGDPLNSSSSPSSFSYFLSSRKLQVENGGVSGPETDASHPVPVHAGMYTMRMLDNDDAMDTSSDSAVSSMGSSERVPSISDGQEWMETTSEAGEGEHRNYYGMECTHAKYRQYNYSYAPGMGPAHRSAGDRGADRRMPPVAQKKYQLFGKRLTVEQAMGGSPYGTLPHGTAAIPQQPSTPMKYPTNVDYRYPSALDGDAGSPSYVNLEGATAPPNTIHLSGNVNSSLDSRYNCNMEYDSRASIQSVPSVSLQSHQPSMEHVQQQQQQQQQHSYQLEDGGNGGRTVRDKTKKKSSLEEHLSRDEKRARSMKIPMTTEDIVNLPMDEFNERLSKYDLTEAQLTLIRDIRRRGKNKVAAQNCRKRKLDQIVMLAEEVQEIQRDREMTIRDQQTLLSEKQMMKEKYSQLYRHVFQSLRDGDGNPYSPYEYSLQQAADGNVILVPRNASGSTNLVLNGSHMTAAHPLAPDDPHKGVTSKRKD